MKPIFYFISLFCIFSCGVKAQWLADTLRYPGEKNIYWTSSYNVECLCQVYVYYYENGQPMKQEMVDTTKNDHFIEHAWLEDGTQTVEDGTGRLIEVDPDSTIYSVSRGKIEGPAWKFKLTYRTQNRPPVWKLYAEGDYRNELKTGAWNFLDSSGHKTATVNYVTDTLRGNCIFYYPDTDSILASGDIENCVKEGEWKYYDEQGNIYNKCNYVNGVKTGEFEEFYPDGKLKIKGLYELDQKKLRVPVEDPFNPGTFKSYKTNLMVSMKTGYWFYYDENGNILKKEKPKNKFDTEDFNVLIYKHKKYYERRRFSSATPDCNYY